jgi:hypothetical protein
MPRARSSRSVSQLESSVIHANLFRHVDSPGVQIQSVDNTTGTLYELAFNQVLFLALHRWPAKSFQLQFEIIQQRKVLSGKHVAFLQDIVLWSLHSHLVGECKVQKDFWVLPPGNSCGFTIKCVGGAANVIAPTLRQRDVHAKQKQQTSPSTAELVVAAKLLAIASPEQLRPILEETFSSELRSIFGDSRMEARGGGEPSRKLIAAVMDIDVSASRDPLDVATGLGIATQAFAEFAKSKIEPVVRSSVPDHRPNKWLTRAMEVLATVVGATSRYGEWCLAIAGLNGGEAQGGRATDIAPGQPTHSADVRTKNQEYATIIFGDQPPSVNGLSDFLSAASKKEYKTRDEKRLICSAINYWKAEFGGSLRYKRQDVKMTVTGGAEDGQFALYTGPTEKKSYRYGDTKFPAHLTFRTKKSAQ